MVSSTVPVKASPESVGAGGATRGRTVEKLKKRARIAANFPEHVIQC